MLPERLAAGALLWVKMELGFETIGNATLVCHDRGPLLVTDPWLVGAPYFGSWRLSHEIPARQMEAIEAVRYVWISHGHPDHLSPESLERLRGKPILLPDHVGGRIAKGLREAGHEVRVLPDGQWIELSDRVRVACVGDYFQDAVLLVDMDGALLVDSNDASDRGIGTFIKEHVARAKRSFLFCLTGYGDADLIHFTDEDGVRLRPRAADKEPPGPGIVGILEHYGIGTYVPFSTMHHYQRSDSVWANEYATGPEDFPRGFESDTKEMLPAYARYDLLRDACERIDPAPLPATVYPSEDFGDDWSEELEVDEVRELRAYLEPIQHVRRALRFIAFRVGGTEHTVDFGADGPDRGITFHAPRGSLLTAVRYAIFDDLLISNFVSATLHGDWPGPPEEALYPDVNPFIGKYADNGGARTPQELARYFDEYRRRGFFGPGPDAFSQRVHASIEPYLSR